MYRSDKDLQWWRPCYSVIGLSCHSVISKYSPYWFFFGFWLNLVMYRSKEEYVVQKKVMWELGEVSVPWPSGSFMCWICTNTDIFSFNPTCIFLNVENTWCVESSVQSSARPHLMWVDLFLFRFRFICPFFLPLTSNQLQEKNRRNYLNKTSEHLTSRYGQNATRLCNNDMFFVHLLSSAIAHMQ